MMKTLVLIVLLISVLVLSAFADCQISATAEVIADGYRYTWSVYFEEVEYYSDEGIKYFFVEVPMTTMVLFYQVPPPYTGDQTDVWSFSEINTDFFLSPFTLCVAPRNGYKWLLYSGNYLDSLYPRGSTATFMAVTDKGTPPGMTTMNTVTLNPWYDFWEPGSGRYYVSEYYLNIGPSNPVPEPLSLLALCGGVAGLLAFRRRRKFQSRIGG